LLVGTVAIVSMSGAYAQSRIEPIFPPTPALASSAAPSSAAADGGVPVDDPTTLAPLPANTEPAHPSAPSDAAPSAPGLSKLTEGEPPPPLSAAEQQRLQKSGDVNLIGRPILAVKIIDNTKTNSNTVEYLAHIKRGSLLTAEVIAKIQLNLDACGLFKSVSIFWEPMEEDGVQGARLIIAAKDKLSWIIAPTATFNAPIFGGGLAYAESNLFGRNMKLLLYGTYTTADKMLLLYFMDPHIGTTPMYWRFDVIARRDYIREYSSVDVHAPRVARATNLDTYGVGLMFGVTAARRLKIDARIKFYYDKVNTPTCYNTTNQNGYGTPDVNAEQGGTCLAPAKSGMENTMALQAAYDGRSTIAGIVVGPLARAEWTYGPRWLGNITGDYHLLNLRFQWGLRFFKEHNLLFKSWGNVYFSPPFKQEIEAGGEDLRGYVFRQFRGDTSFRATVEYIVPVFTILGFSLRAIAFFDTNLTWFRDIPRQVPGQPRVDPRGTSFRNFLPDTPSGVVRDSWHNGLGGGVRLYLKGVILPLVGVDLAYGIESRAFQYYITIGSAID